MGLIKKICLDSKKPAFQWIGNSGLDELIRELRTSARRQEAICDSIEEKTKTALIVQTKEQQSEIQPVAQEKAPLPEERMEGFMNRLLSLCQEAQMNCQPSLPGQFAYRNRFPCYPANFGGQNQSLNQYNRLLSLQKAYEEARALQRSQMNVSIFF